LKRRSLPVAAALTATAALLLTACGSGDDKSSTNDKIAGAEQSAAIPTKSAEPSAAAAEKNPDGVDVSLPKDINLVLNTPFALLRTAKTPVIQRVSYFPTSADAEKIFSPLHNPKDTVAFRPMNVVVIILESFSKEYIGYFNKGKGYTPFLRESAPTSPRTASYSC
jgi:hypothetical protein